MKKLSSLAIALFLMTASVQTAEASLLDFITSARNRIVIGSSDGIGIIITALGSFWSNHQPQRAILLRDPDDERRLEISTYGAIGVGTGSTAFGNLNDCLKSGGGSGELMSFGTCGAGGTSVNTGALRSAFDSRYVEIAGDTMTGALVIQSSSLTASSATITGDLSASGALFVEGNSSFATIVTGVWNGTAIDFSTYTNATAGDGITFTDDSIAADLGTTIVTGEITDGTILEVDLDESSGSATDNDVLTFNSAGSNFTWIAQSTLPGATALSSTGALQATFDSRYVRVAGDTMTGGLLIQGSNPPGTIEAGLLLEVSGTMSGYDLHAQDLLTSSGGLTVEGNMSGTTLYWANQATGSHLDIFGKNPSAVHLTVQAAPSQTAELFSVRDSSGNEFFDIHENGEVDITHTATEDGETALGLTVDGAGSADFKAIDIDYDAGTLGVDELETIIQLGLNRFDTTGGDIVGVNCSATEGSADFHCMEVSAEAAVILQHVGTFGDMDIATLTGSTNVLSAFISTSTDVAIFPNDNDTLEIANAATFDEVEFVLDTNASNPGIKPTFEYSTGVATWQTFVPIDGTEGMRTSNIIEWETETLSPAWATATGSNYYFRITRTQNNLTTEPIEDLVQIVIGDADYSWNEDGNIYANSISGAILEASALFSGASIHAQDRLTSSGVLTVEGVAQFDGLLTLGDGGDTVEINSSDWDISTTGTITNVDMNGDLIDDGTVDGTEIDDAYAGRSLTENSNILDIDAEIFTQMANAGLLDPVTGDDGAIQWKFATAITITRISCDTDVGTVTIQLDERGETTPNSAGTDVMSSTLVCDTNNQATTSFANAGIAADAPLNVDIDATASSPTQLRIHVDYTIDD